MQNPSQTCKNITVSGNVSINDRVKEAFSSCIYRYIVRKWYLFYQIWEPILFFFSTDHGETSKWDRTNYSSDLLNSPRPIHLFSQNISCNNRNFSQDHEDHWKWRITTKCIRHIWYSSAFLTNLAQSMNQYFKHPQNNATNEACMALLLYLF